MLAELREDNSRLVVRMKEAHGLCDENGVIATASLLEVWIDEAENRASCLFAAGQPAESAGPYRERRSGPRHRGRLEPGKEGHIVGVRGLRLLS